jgi:hypothetical protein
VSIQREIFNALSFAISKGYQIHPDAALTTFREWRCLPNKFKQMMVQQVADDPTLIGEIYEGLKKMKPQSKYKLTPIYNVMLNSKLKCFREALIRNLTYDI